MKKILMNVVAVTGAIVFASSSVFAGGLCPQDRKTKTAPDEYLSKKNPFHGNAEAIAAGKKLFHKTAKPVFCEQCHGKTGEGNGKIGKAFKPPKSPRNFTCAETMKAVPPGQMFWIIENGSAGTGMVSHKKTLTEDQIWQVISYIEKDFIKR